MASLLPAAPLSKKGSVHDSSHSDSSPKLICESTELVSPPELECSGGENPSPAESCAVVKVGSDKYYLDLEAACIEYVSNYCKEWHKLDRAFFFPPAFPTRYIAPTGKASGAVSLSRSEEQDVKGDEAELKVFHCLEKFCQKQPMFVLTKFEFGSFITEILTKTTGESKVAMEGSHTQMLESPGEVDFIVVHRNVGILLFEVKATEKFKPARYQDAKKQLDTAEFFIQALLNLKQINKVIPVFKVVALPNVTTLGRSSEGSEYIDLRYHDITGQECIDKWWCTYFRNKHWNSAQEHALLELVAILVGQRASLCSYASVIDSVYSTIDSQSFLARTFQKDRKKRPQSSASLSAMQSKNITKVSNDPGCSILADQFMFLNPEQLSIWDGPVRQIFTGVTGSGKTILVQHKALECACRGDQVLVLVPSPLNLLYQQFFTENSHRIENPKIVQVISFDDLPEFMSKSALNTDVTSKVHIFADEFQSLISNPCRDQLLNFKEFIRFLAQYQILDSYQWLCYDKIQTQNELMLTDDYQRWEEFESFKTDICKSLKFFNAETMSTAMRYTKEIYTFLSSRFPYKTVTSFPMQKGLEDLENPSIYLGHNVSGPQVLVQVLPGMYLEEHYMFATHYILKELEEWATMEGQCDYRKIAVLSERPEDIPSLCKQLEDKGIPVCSIGDTKNAITVGCGLHTKSFEWLVVLVFCKPSVIRNDILLISRAVVRLIFLEVDSYSS